MTILEWAMLTEEAIVKPGLTWPSPFCYSEPLCSPIASGQAFEGRNNNSSGQLLPTWLQF
jgi:hypothetical protein